MLAMMAGAARVLLRRVWAPIYIGWLRARVAVWGAAAFEHAVAQCPPWLALAILRAFGARIGHGVDFHGRLNLHGAYQPAGKLTVGAWCHIGDGVTLDLVAPITLGDRCTLSLNASILTHEDVGYSPLAAAYPSRSAPVTIEDGAYIGAGAIILMGVRVGRCAVVGAGAVVRADVPAYAVAVGVPARVVRHLDPTLLTAPPNRGDPIMNPPEHGARYDTTRRAWEDIWHQASVEVELETQDYPRAREAVGHYRPYLPKDGLILEAGSGLGAALIPLKRDGYRVIGLDYAENALHIAHGYDPALPQVVGDVHTLPFAENAIGAYLSFGVFEHFEAGMARPLAEAFRVLRPGGCLVLTIPYPNLVHDWVAWRRRAQGASLLTDDSFFESTYSRAALTDAVRAAGFAIVRVVPTSHAYTLWGLHPLFRAPGYYRTSQAAELLGGLLRLILPWAFNFSTMVIARKP